MPPPRRSIGRSKSRKVATLPWVPAVFPNLSVVAPHWMFCPSKPVSAARATEPSKALAEAGATRRAIPRSRHVQAMIGASTGVVLDPPMISHSPQAYGRLPPCDGRSRPLIELRWRALRVPLQAGAHASLSHRRLRRLIDVPVMQAPYTLFASAPNVLMVRIISPEPRERKRFRAAHDAERCIGSVELRSFGGAPKARARNP